MNKKLLYQYTKNISVLYLEHDKNYRDEILKFLESYFLDVVSVSDANEGLEIFLNTQDSIDLVIIDIDIPNMNGLEICRKIVSKNPEIPVIITSKTDNIAYLHEAIKLGVLSFLVKPFNDEKLQDTIYRASQRICDAKLVLSHLDLIEDLSIELDEQNKELKKKNDELEKTIRMLNTMVNKEQIINLSVEESDETKEPLQKDESAFNIQIKQLVHEDLHELRELHLEIDTSIINSINSGGEILQEDIKKIIDSFNRYSSVLTYHSFFAKLASAMKAFVITFKDNPIPESLESRNNILVLLESFLYVLEKWQNELELGNKEMINFFDASIISDMETISNMWVQSPQEEEDYGEMEFF